MLQRYRIKYRVERQCVSIQTRVTDEAVDGISSSLCPMPQVHHTDTANTTIPPIHTTSTHDTPPVFAAASSDASGGAASSAASSLNESTRVETDADTACAAAATATFVQETSFSTSVPHIQRNLRFYTADCSLSLFRSGVQPAAKMSRTHRRCEHLDPVCSCRGLAGAL